MTNIIISTLSGRSFTVLPSLARTETPNTIEYRNLNPITQGITVVIDVTAKTGTPSIVATIYGVDPFIDQTWTILASAAIITTGTTVLRVHPGITAAANSAAADTIPANIRIGVAHTGSDSITYSVSGHLT
jgi:hypothetical protein